MAGVFESRGFRTILAGDGEEALDVVSRETVHLLLLDMHMPRLTGVETMRRAKLLRSPLPCILMSAALDEEICRAAIAAEAYSVLAKPVSVREITRVVEQALAAAFGWRRDG